MATTLALMQSPMADLDYCCPRCHSTLLKWVDRYECRACTGVYPIIAGIPDFRLFPDPYIGLEDDRAKGLRLLDKAREVSFAELVRYYYSITPEVSDDLAQHYIRHHLAGLARGNGVIERLETYGFSEVMKPGSQCLDLGCGTAGIAAAAAARGMVVAGTDIAFRWLVIGRKRLEALGCENVPVVCACAERLPFPDFVFDLVIAEGLLEHTHAQNEIFREAARVRRPMGGFAARTVNRFALGPEPHVGVWGVGFLPRRWMAPYVRWAKGISYQNIRLESVGGLRQLITESGAHDLIVRTPYFAPGDYMHRPRWQQFFFKAYNILARLPVLQILILWFGPFIDITGHSPKASGTSC